MGNPQVLLTVPVPVPVRATLCSVQCAKLVKEIQSFYKYEQHKYKSITNLAKEI